MRNKKEHRLVTAANALANPLDLVSEPRTLTIPSREGRPISCVLEHHKAVNISPKLVPWLMDLMTRNMKHFYEASSWGWNEEEKRQEMLEQRAQYLLVVDEGQGDTRRQLAFTHFRFDMDHGRPVLYCYEIQVEPDAQGLKLGSVLLGVLESMAVAAGLKRVVLTVLLNNPRSVSFFRNHGYVDDETNLEGPRDYLILSKRVHKGGGT